MAPRLRRSCWPSTRAPRPSDRAGLRPGELIVAANDQPIATADELATVLAELRPGQRATVDLVDSDGDKRTVTVELGELPPP